MPPTVIFGDIKHQPDLPKLKALLLQNGIDRFDTAALYGGGESERRLGDAKTGDDFILDTKIWCASPADGTLTPEAVDKSSATSLQKLQVNQVNVMYCHDPDFATPLEDQARGFQEVYDKGRFKYLGLSNFMPDMVAEWLHISKKKGYIRPTWFQGQYNLFCRTYEDDLFPLMRREGMHFAAYSPLAGGFLNGNLQPMGKRGTRFVQSKQYLRFYDRDTMHSGFKKLQDIAVGAGVATDEMGLRWLMHHSQLQDGDAIVIGASSLEQVATTVKNLGKGPLEESVVKALNALWEDAEMQAAAYENIDPRSAY